MDGGNVKQRMHWGISYHIDSDEFKDILTVYIY